MANDRGTVKRDPARTHARILAAATDIFAEHGFAGARVETITQAAGISTRMLYHYFDDKAGLYVAVLEHLLGELRQSETRPIPEDVTGLDGILGLFDRIYMHFGDSPELIRILSTENIMSARFLKSSIATPKIASPSLRNIEVLHVRGLQDGTIARRIDPLHLYVVMVGLAFFHRSNGDTLSHIWATDVLANEWQDTHRHVGRQMLGAYLTTPDA